MPLRLAKNPLQIEQRFSGFEQGTWIEGQRFGLHIFDGADAPDAHFNGVVRSFNDEQHPTLHTLWEGDVASLPAFIEQKWSSVAHSSLGVLLGRYELPLSDEEIEALRYAIAPFPDGLTPFLYLDGSKVSRDALFQLPRHHLEHFHLIVRGAFRPYALPVIGVDHSTPFGTFGAKKVELLPEIEIPLALLLPPEPKRLSVSDTMAPFRIIPEALLTQEWEGVEQLIVNEEWLSSQGRRKIQGFIAAGGSVVTYS